MDWGEFGKKIIGKKMIVLLLVTGAVYFFLQYLTPLSAPVLLAMLFVTIFGPMMKRMNQRLHFPRPLSAIVLLIVATVLLVGLLWILVSWMLGSLPVWIGNLELREQEWLEAVRGLCRSVGEIIGVDTAYLENTVSGRLQEGLDSLEENILPGMLSQSMQYVQWFAELGGFLVTFLSHMILVANASVFALNKTCATPYDGVVLSGNVILEAFTTQSLPVTAFVLNSCHEVL